MEWLTVVVADPIKAMLVKIWGYVMPIIGAIIILLIGWLIAKFIESVIVRVLRAAKLDVASDKAGISNVLAHGDIKLTVSEIIGAIIYWIVILAVIVTALNSLNLVVAANLLSRLAEYVPNILLAVFILVFGSLLANFIATIVRTAASNAGVEKAKLMGQLTKLVLIIFAVIVAIEQLNIATTLIAVAVNVVLAAVGLGIAIAFGLGCKDIAGKMMQDWINKLNK